jgi:hypothetical protein
MIINQEDLTEKDKKVKKSEMEPSDQALFAFFDLSQSACNKMANRGS